MKEAPTCQQCARQCRNLTSAVARLVSVGVCVAGLGQCGLEVMKLAVEAPGAVQDRSMIRLVCI